ncbi:hypothetical protein [Streptomyces sp. NPDC012888]|uniref:FitA-like ribbon-helix-helix domain-containing protein n=1 Tax=Streptomyces sp. NPDC012888 TaxID=3364855 RepID=UPI0036A5A0DE
MATLHLHGLSAEVLDDLKARAARNHQSLQTYVRNLLDDDRARQKADEGGGPATPNR